MVVAQFSLVALVPGDGDANHWPGDERREPEDASQHAVRKDLSNTSLIAAGHAQEYRDIPSHDCTGDPTDHHTGEEIDQPLSPLAFRHVALHSPGFGGFTTKTNPSVMLMTLLLCFALK